MFCIFKKSLYIHNMNKRTLVKLRQIWHTILQYPWLYIIYAFLSLYWCISYFSYALVYDISASHMCDGTFYDILLMKRFSTLCIIFGVILFFISLFFWCKVIQKIKRK